MPNDSFLLNIRTQLERLNAQWQGLRLAAVVDRPSVIEELIVTVERVQSNV